MSTTRALELQKFFNNLEATAGSAWEALLLANACRVSMPLATRMLSQMGLGNDTENPFRLFENACGVGVVAPILQKIIKPEMLQQSSIVCGDFSEEVVGLAKKRAKSEGWVNTEVTKVDAQRTGFADGAFTHVAASIAFHVIPDSEAALNDAIRILQPGGILGFTTWHKEAGWFTTLKEAFKSLPFEAPCEMELATSEWGEWSDVNWIKKTLGQKGLEDVQVELFAFLSHIDSPEYFVTNCGPMMDWIMSSCWSEELRNEHPKEEVRPMVQEFLEKKHGGGGWDVSWVAVVASGRVPSEVRV